MLILLNHDTHNVLLKNSLCDKMVNTHKARWLQTLHDDWQLSQRKAHVQVFELWTELTAFLRSMVFTLKSN